MRPIILTMTAFGPYAGKEVVDFRDAVASGLFGIYGSTGSGKSTIFSAITFALFGEASNSDQEASSLRSHHAADDVLTRVDFIFEVGAARYLIRRTPDQMRPALRGEGETKDVHKAWLFDVTGIDCDDITEDNCGKVIAEKKVGLVKTAVLNRLGYGAEQFRQIVLLPQGKFETFLTANTDERRKILRELFDVSLYRKLAQTLKDEAKEAEDAVIIDRRTCAGRLSQEGYESPDALKIGITQAKAEQAEADTVSSTAAQAAIVAAQKKADADQLVSIFLASKKAQVGLAELEAKAADMGTAETKLNNARKAQSLLDIETAKITAQTALDTVEAELTTTKIANEAAAKNKDGAAKHLTAQDALANTRDEQRRRTEELGRHTTTLTKAQTLKMNWESAHTKQAKDNAAYDQVEARLTESLAKHLDSQSQANTAQSGRLERSKLNTELTQAKRALEEATAHAKAHTLWSDAKSLSEKAAVDHIDSQKQLGDAQSLFDQAETELAAAQAQHLAEKLAEGEPCSVCGSKLHPSPATGHAESGGLDQAFRDARTELDSKRAVDANAAQTQSGFNAKLEERKASLDNLPQPEHTIEVAHQLVEELSGRLTALGLEANIEEIKAEIAHFAGDVANSQSATTKARTLLENSKTATALAKQAYETALGTVPSDLRNETALMTASENAIATLKTMQGALKSAQDADKVARDAALSCAKDLESTEKKLLAAQSALKQAENTFADRLREQGFTREAFNTHRAYIDQIDVLKNHINAHKEALAIAQDRAKTALQAIKDKVRPDIDALTQASLTADAARTTETAKAAALKTRTDQLETLLKSISAELVRIEKVEQDTAALRELAALFNANNNEKLDLETFAIGAMFDQVLQAANLRLQPMTDRQYSLERELDGKGSGRRGLGICVHDVHTGKTRATSTLSGGETFIAALSLALGLSDIVESVNGNIRLDTIFIDEGFGSLDTDNDSGTLDRVLQTLQDLVGDNRAVGLISHVQLVQNAIPNGFSIKKTAAGSHVEARGF